MALRNQCLNWTLSFSNHRSLFPPREISKLYSDIFFFRYIFFPHFLVYKRSESNIEGITQTKKPVPVESSSKPESTIMGKQLSRIRRGAMLSSIWSLVNLISRYTIVLLGGSNFLVERVLYALFKVDRQKEYPQAQHQRRSNHFGVAE